MKDYLSVLCAIKNILEKEDRDLDERINFMEHRKEYLTREIENLRKKIEKAKIDYSKMETFLDHLMDENVDLERL